MKQTKYITMTLLLIGSLTVQAIDFPEYRPVPIDVNTMYQMYVSSMDRASASNKSDVFGETFESPFYMRTAELPSCFESTPLLNEDGTAAEIVATIHGPRRVREEGTDGGNAGTPGGSSGGQLGQPIGDALYPLLFFSFIACVVITFRQRKQKTAL